MRIKLSEALEVLQEMEFMGGPGMEYRPDYTTGQRDPKNSPRNWKTFTGDDSVDSGPWNAQGRGPGGIGRGGTGGSPDDSGGIRLPSKAYTTTSQHEGADFEETQRHGGERRNIWVDTPEAADLRKKVQGQLDSESSWEQMAEGWKNWAAGAALGASLFGAAPAYAADNAPRQAQQTQVQQGQFKNLTPQQQRVVRKWGFSQEDIKAVDNIPNEGNRQSTLDSLVQKYRTAAYLKALHVNEAAGQPARAGLVAPMDGLSVQSSGRDARPVKDVNGDDVSPVYMPDPVDPMTGPGNLSGGPGTIPGATRGWANAPANMKRENVTMKLQEFFDPSPVEVEEIENPDQDKHGDESDEELEFGDDDMSGDDHDGDVEIQGDIDGVDIHGTADEDGIEDLMQQIVGGGDELGHPGDGDDLGEPQNMVLMPHSGHGMFSQSPDQMGSARGTFGLQSDSMGGHSSSEVHKSSAWDVLSKVVNAMGPEDEEHENPIFGDEL